VKRYGKYRRKVSWIVKRYGNYGKKQVEYGNWTNEMTESSIHSSSSSHSVEIPPKTRYKHKQNETHYENITH
jgi:hypothetical protein